VGEVLAMPIRPGVFFEPEVIGLMSEALEAALQTTFRRQPAVIAHPYPSDQAAVRSSAGAARASRMATSALRPTRRPVATTEQRSA
jgi:hypothetical protein